MPEAKARPALEADMIAFVRRISDHAKRTNPGFRVIMQNAEALLDDLGHPDANRMLVPGGPLPLTRPGSERRVALEQLVGIEDRIWVQVADQQAVFGIADEDLERSTETKTSAIHFLRFELPPESVNALRAGAALVVGVDHPKLTLRADHIPETLHESLLADLH